MKTLVKSIFLLFVIVLANGFLIPILAETIPAHITKVVQKMKTLKSFRANVVFSHEDSNISGILYYGDNKAHLKLHDGRVIATNGIYMIAFNPVSGVAGKQEVKETSSGGLGWLLSGFSYETSIEDRNAIGQNTRPQASIQSFNLTWDENYILRKLSILRKNQTSWTHFYLSDVQILTSVSPALFSYRPPTRSRTVENALNHKN